MGSLSQPDAIGFNMIFTHPSRFSARQYARFHDMIENRDFAGKRAMAAVDRSSSFSHDSITPKEDDSPIICPFCESGVPKHLRSFPSRTGFISHVQFIHQDAVDDSALPFDFNKADKSAVSTIKSYIRDKKKYISHDGQKYREMGLEEEAEESSDEEVESVTALLLLRNDCTSLIRTNPFDFVNISRDFTPERSNRFRLMGRSFDMQLNFRGQAAASLGLGLVIIECLYKYLIDKMVDVHTGSKPFYISLGVDGEDLSHPITSPYLKATEININRYLTDLSLASTSHPILFLDKKLTITINCFGIETQRENFKQIYFGGRCRNNYSTVEEFIIRKKGFHGVVPNIAYNHDCLLVSIILGVTMIEKRKSGSEWRRLRMFTKPLECQMLTVRIIQLAKQFPNIDFNSPQSLDICPQFQNYLNKHHKIQLKIYSGCKYEDLKFEGEPGRDVCNQINLILMHNHLSLISDPLSFFGVKECSGCLGFYKRRQKSHRECPNRKKFCHKCGGVNCYRYMPDPVDVDVEGILTFPMICKICNGLFSSKGCYLSHKYQSGQCRKMIYCVTCGKKMSRSDSDTEAHNCLIIKCQKCNTHCSLAKGERHLCTIQRAGLRDLGILKSWGDIKGITYHNSKRDHQIVSEKARPIDQIGQLCEGSNLSTRGEYSNDLSIKYPHIVGKFGIVAYDIETRTCPKSKKLIPYALTAIFVCSACAFVDYLNPERWKVEYPCCGIRKRSYFTAPNIKQFIMDLFFKKKHRSVVAFSFNGSGFDNVFILDMLLSNGLTPKVNMAGRKIMQLTLNGVILKDLRLYLSGRLADIPAAFNFQHVVHKGFFPFLLSNYVKDDYRSSQWPSINFYQPHLINSTSERQDLSEYIESKQADNVEFIFMDECLKYCMQDSLIVLIAVLSLEKTNLAETHSNISFIRSRSFTLAGLSATYYRHIFMKDNSIGLVPPVGYAFDKQSLPGEIYFRYLNMKRKMSNLPLIMYNRNNVFGEFRVNSYKVDGSTETALYEYHGCFWHASPCCYSGKLSNIHPIYKLPFYQIQYMDRIRLQRIREITNKPIVVINHCKVLKLMKTSAEFKAFYDNQISLNSIKYHVDIRGALYGGRVEPFGVSCRLTQSEISRGVRIKMLDVVSLYPYIQMTSIFPKNLHPTIIDGFEIRNNGQNLSIDSVKCYFGVFSLFYIPPKSCMFPIVPFRHEGKIVFGNCRKCMIYKHQKCTHSDSERGFNCMLNSVDLEQGLIDGGRIGRIYEIYDWGRESTRTDLFSDMIKHLIIGKIMSKEGAELISDDKKLRIRKAYKDIGVNIENDGWHSSPAKYQYYKILLNSLWGKLAQRPGGYTDMVFAKSYEDIEKILEDGTKEVKYVHEINPTMVAIQTKDISTLQCDSPAFYNPFIASLVTSYSRLLITNHIRRTGASALYTDTDSIIYKSDPNEPLRDPKVNENKLIGGLVSEFPENIYISKIVMIASKSYIMQLSDDKDPSYSKTIIKLKGISMKLAVKQSLSVELLEKIALGELKQVDGDEFYDQLAKMTSKEYVDPARVKFHNTGYLNIPQPLLKKENKDFGLNEQSKFAKRIRANSDKRMIQIPVIFRDKSLDPYDDAISEFPSLPFGYIDDSN